MPALAIRRHRLCFLVDIIDVFEACIDGTLDQIDLQFADNACVCVVLASNGYPVSYEKGFPIRGLATFKEHEGYYCFHAGTKFKDGEIVKASEPVIICQCIRVPVLDGHTAAVFVKFRKKPTKEQLIEKLVNFKGLPQELELPSAPKQFIQYLEEDNRPQVQLDVNYEKGMGVSVGRLREDKVYDWKFVGLSHNTLRGAAGGAVLCAELLTAQGYIQAK